MREVTIIGFNDIGNHITKPWYKGKESALYIIFNIIRDKNI